MNRFLHPSILLIAGYGLASLGLLFESLGLFHVFYSSFFGVWDVVYFNGLSGFQGLTILGVGLLLLMSSPLISWSMEARSFRFSGLLLKTIGLLSLVAGAYQLLLGAIFFTSELLAKIASNPCLGAGGLTTCDPLSGFIPQAVPGAFFLLIGGLYIKFGRQRMEPESLSAATIGPQ